MLLEAIRACEWNVSLEPAQGRWEGYFHLDGDAAHAEIRSRRMVASGGGDGW